MPALGQTPSQTVGPFFSMRLSAEGENVLGGDGDRIRIEGTVTDGGGVHVEDALLEIWQANQGGRYRHDADTRDEIPIEGTFSGFGRATTDFDTGAYWFETVKPGSVPDPEGEPQAPHITVTVQARGLQSHLFTRIYFSDEEAANSHDMVLRTVPVGRRSTIIAQLMDDGDPKRYALDIRLQGEHETVFFDI